MAKGTPKTCDFEGRGLEKWELVKRQLFSSEPFWKASGVGLIKNWSAKGMSKLVLNKGQLHRPKEVQLQPSSMCGGLSDMGVRMDRART